MSAARKKEKKPESGGASTWHVRVEDGTVYGPERFAVLYDWSTQSRIVAGNMISEDGENWTPAEDVPALRMEWMAELSDGEAYGPFNLMAASQLVKDEVLQPNATLTNRSTGRTLNVSEVLKPAEDLKRPPPAVRQAGDSNWRDKYYDENKTRLRLEQESTDAGGRLERYRAEREEQERNRAKKEVTLQSQVQTLQQRLQAAEQACEAARSSLGDEVSRRSAVERSSGEQSEALLDKAARMEGEAVTLKERFQRAQEDLGLERAQQVESRLAESKRETELTGRFDAVSKQLQETTQALESTRQDLAGARNQNETMSTERVAEKTRRDEAIANLQSDIQTTRAELADVRENLAEQQELAERLPGAEQQLAALAAAQKASATAHAQTESEKEELVKQAREAAQAHTQTLTRLADEHAAEKAQLAEQLTERRAAVERAQAQMAQLQEALAEKQAAVERLPGVEQQLADQAVSLQSEAAASKVALEQMQGELAEKQALGTQLATVEEQLAEVGRSDAALREELATTAQALATAQGRIESLASEHRDEVGRLTDEIGKRSETLKLVKLEHRAQAELFASQDRELRETVARMTRESDQAFARVEESIRELEAEKTLHRKTQESHEQRMRDVMHNLNSLQEEKQTLIQEQARMAASAEKYDTENQEQVTALNDEVSRLHDASRGAEGKLKTLQDEFEKELAAQAERDKEAADRGRQTQEELNRHIQELREEIEKQARDAIDAREALEAGQAASAAFQSKVDAAEAERAQQLAELQEKADDTGRQLAATLAELDAEQRQHVEAKEALSEKENTFDSQFEELQELLRAKTRIVEEAQAELEQDQKLRAEIDKRSQKLTADLAGAVAAREAAESELTKIKAGRDKLRDEVAALRAEKQKAKKQMDAQKRQETQLAVVVAAAKSEKMPETHEKWYVRSDEDQIYGPVKLAELRHWAIDARIAPGYSLSRDKQDWIPAEALPELEMDWRVALDDGSMYGPLHILAIQDLVENEMASPQAKILHDPTGKESTIDRIPPAEIVEALASGVLYDGAERARAIGPSDAAAGADVKLGARYEDLEKRNAATDGKVKDLTAKLKDGDKKVADLEDRLKKASRPARAMDAKWFMKSEDGVVFGPTKLADLCDWAAQARVAPEHQFSQDKKTWLPAEELPGLAMEWKVELEGGALYGPLHILAIQDLVENKMASPTAKIVHTPTGKESTIDRIPPAEIVEALVSPVIAPPVVRQGTAKAKMSELEGKVATLEEKLKSAEKLAEDAAARLKDEERKIAELAKKAAEPQRVGEPAMHSAVATLTMSWFVKSDDGSVYGPVAINEIVDWATQCRIGPGYALSEDKKIWRTVDQIPELKMEWSVELLDGSSYGPLHILAISDLIDDGLAAPNAKIMHRATKGVFTADKIPAPDILAAIAEPPGMPGSTGDAEMLRRDLDGERKRVSDLEKTIAELRKPGAKTGKPPRQVSIPAPPQSVRSQLAQRLKKSS